MLFSFMLTVKRKLLWLMIDFLIVHIRRLGRLVVHLTLMRFGFLLLKKHGLNCLEVIKELKLVRQVKLYTH